MVSWSARLAKLIKSVLMVLGSCELLEKKKKKHLTWASSLGCCLVLEGFCLFSATETPNNILFFVCVDILYHSFDRILGKFEKKHPIGVFFSCLQ